MPGVFAEDGIRFQYPENWQLEREETASGWTVTVQSPQTAFLLVSLDYEMLQPEEMATAALEALRGEYSELEADERIETVAGQPAYGHDIRFFSLDLTNSCWSRCFFSGQGTVHLYWQANDLELERLEPVLQAMCASLCVEDE